MVMLVAHTPVGVPDLKRLRAVRDVCREDSQPMINYCQHGVPVGIAGCFACKAQRQLDASNNVFRREKSFDDIITDLQASLEDLRAWHHRDVAKRSRGEFKETTPA